MPEPFVREAEKIGLKDFFSIASLKIPFWWNGIMTREGIIKAKRPLLQKLARAVVEAIHIIKSEKEYAKALFKKNLGISDPEGFCRWIETSSGHRGVQARLCGSHYKLGDAFQSRGEAQGCALLLAMRLLPADRRARSITLIADNYVITRAP